MKKYVSISIKTFKFLLIALFVTVLSIPLDQAEVRVVNGNLNKTLNLTAMAEKVQNDIDNSLYSVKDTFVGDLTGYGADCPLCSGYLYCTNENVSDGRIYHQDDTYGQVRIVASSNNLPCGTIISFENERISSEPVVAIVLDRGVGGTSLDLLTPSSAYAYDNVGRQEIIYDVLRKGWGDE